MPLIQLTQVSKTYPLDAVDVPALTGIDLTIPRPLHRDFRSVRQRQDHAADDDGRRPILLFGG
jgi:hypothetical protein